MYILSINNESQLLDLVAYSGYKFVGIIATLVMSEILTPGRGTGGWVGWVVFMYTFLANAFFLVSDKFFVTSAFQSVDKLPAPLVEVRSTPRLNQ